MQLLTHELGRRRVRIAVVISASMLVVPVLGLARTPNHGSTGAQSVAAVGSRADVAARLALVSRASRSEARLLPEDDVTTSSTTTTTRAPAKRVATATALRRPSTTVHRTTTTTRRPAPTTTTTTRPAHDMSGGASWYDAPTGSCAMRDAPKGTVVHVTNLANGKSTTCTVSDYGPTMQDRIIDLSKGSFAQIADPSQGVIQVRVTW